MRRRLRQKLPRFNAEQEAAYEAASDINTRARIYELGVAAILKEFECCDNETAVAAQVLAEVVKMRRAARARHEEVRKQVEAAKPRRKVAKP